MHIQVKKRVETPSDRLWATVASGGEVHRWFGEVITSCELTGSGEGAARNCTMANGALLEERILEIDHSARRFRYAIDTHPLPAQNVIATVTIASIPGGGSEVTWAADYQAAPEHEPLVRKTLEDLYTQGIRSLEAFHATAKA
ncbi:MAG: SRPBCC family protein [Pseudomonadota bacterium]